MSLGDQPVPTGSVRFMDLSKEYIKSSFNQFELLKLSKELDRKSVEASILCICTIRQDFLFNSLLSVYCSVISIKLDPEHVLNEELCFDLRNVCIFVTFSGANWRRPLRMRYTVVDGKFQSLPDTAASASELVNAGGSTSGLIIVHDSDAEPDEDEMSADMDF